MKVYNFKALLEENGIKNPEDSKLYHVVDCLEAIGIKISTTGPWVAGGAVLKTFLNEELNTDVDIFFSDTGSYFKSLELMKQNANLTGSSVFSQSFDCTFEHNGIEKHRKVQLVNYVFKGTACEIIENFDINICQIAFDGEKIIVSEDSIEDMRNKRMKILVDKVTHPGSTFKRIVKYTSRGFVASNENLQDFAKTWIINSKEYSDEKY